jgi:hypothetical protein
MTDANRLAGIGHNAGPALDDGRSWRRFAWGKARAALWRPAPLEVIRRQLRRAKALGLDHKQYSSIVLGSGRDLRAFVVTERAVAGLAAPRLAKLAAVEDCDLALLGRARLAELLAQAGIVLAEWGPPPPSRASPAQARAALRAVLDGRRIPGDAAAMIGVGATEKAWAEAGRLAKFLPAQDYFPAS